MSNTEKDSKLLLEMSIKQAVIANDISHMVEWTKTHTKQDDARHDDNIKKFDVINGALEGLKEFKWKSTAIVGAVLVMIDIAIKWFYK